MGGLSEGFLGRQLLSIRNKIRLESDMSRLRKLHRKEIRILVQLGNTALAGEIAEKLIADNPSWPPGYSILADLFCISGKWEEAEKLFEKAAAEHESEGNENAAEKLRTGPVYRLSEARKDYRKCLVLCSGRGELKSILEARSRRLLSDSYEIPIPPPEQPLALARRLYYLEKAWSGSSPSTLLEVILNWENTEPEWRWRYIVESIDIWKRKGLDTRQWSSPVRDTACPVLDPRFHAEWRNLSNDRQS